MSQDRHITQCPTMTPWYSLGTFFLLWFLYCILAGRFSESIGVLNDSGWGFGIGIIVCGVIVFFIHRALLDGDVILTAEGVEIQSRIKRSCAWKNCAQVIAMPYDRERILVLLKSGGSPLKTDKDTFWFFLRNPGKVIFLPDDKFTRAFVETYYGPLDIVKSGEKPSP